MAEEKNSFINPKNLIEGDFFKEAGLDNLPEEEKKKLLQKMLESIKNRVLVRIDDLISEAKREDFHKILEKGSDEEIRGFLEANKIDLEQLTIEESILQKAELLKAIKDAKK